MTTPLYSHEMLAETAAAASHMTELLEKLGVENTNGKRRAMWARLRRTGIDISHWDRSPRRWYTDEALAAAAGQSTSYAGVLRILGVPVTGGQHAHLARRIRKAGVDTSHFLGQSHNRGKTWTRRTPEDVLVILPGHACNGCPL